MATTKTTAAKTVEDAAEKTVTVKFTKKQLKESKKYREYRDILSVVLKDSESYSHDDVEKFIDDFLNGKGGKG